MQLLDTMLGKLLNRGELTIIGPGGKAHRYGSPDPDLNPVTVRLMDNRAAIQIVRDPAVGTVEAWMDDRLRFEQGDVLDLVTMIRGNSRWEDRSGRSTWKPYTSRLRHYLNTLNNKASSRQNVVHHYDVGNELYRTFLEPDMQYSCGYFTDFSNSIEQAQLDKKTHVAAKLLLEPGQRVLDIGCGWGGMAMYLNRVADVDVLGVTLSDQQLKVARERAAAAGVSHRVKFELMDYRDLTGQFDRVVSVGMFEHLGTAYFETFFHKIHDLLAPDGVSLIHTMGRMGKPGTTDKFMQKYVFPGGYLPALSEIVTASEKARLIMSDCEMLRQHYIHTLRAWYYRFKANHDEVVRLADERFYRLYAFYLAASSTMFSDGGMCVYQLQYLRSRYAAPVTRNYMVEDEKKLAIKAGEPPSEHFDEAAAA